MLPEAGSDRLLFIELRSSSFWALLPRFRHVLITLVVVRLMSVDFVAGFVSGIAGLVIGSPLDIIKTNDQSSLSPISRISIQSPKTWFAGLLLPTIGLGFLNAILFWSYGLVSSLVDAHGKREPRTQLMVSFVAGLISGICVCVVSVPTELVKVQAQTSDQSSLEVVRRITREEGPRGFCRGALITILRDSIGYGFYFLTYDGLLSALVGVIQDTTIRILVVGGLAGCVSWFSIFPLDTIKTRLQAANRHENHSLLPGSYPSTEEDVDRPYQHVLILNTASTIYGEGGVPAFFRGVMAAMLRAFVVNAAIFYINDMVQSLLNAV